MKKCIYLTEGECEEKLIKALVQCHPKCTSRQQTDTV